MEILCLRHSYSLKFPYRSSRLLPSEVVGFSPNRLPCPAPRFLADVFAKRDLGFALFTNKQSAIIDRQGKIRYYSLSNLFAAICAQLGRARAHDVVGWRDVSLGSSVGHRGQLIILLQ
jgi:hypothetical protein